MGGRPHFYIKTRDSITGTEGIQKKIQSFTMADIHFSLLLMVTLLLVTLGASETRLETAAATENDADQYPYSFENSLHVKRGFWDKRGFGDKRDISDEKLSLLQEMIPQRRVSFGFLHYPRIPLLQRPFFRSNPKLVSLLKKATGKRGFWDKRGFGDKRNTNKESNDFHLYADI